MCFFTIQFVQEQKFVKTTSTIPINNSFGIYMAPTHIFPIQKAQSIAAAHIFSMKKVMSCSRARNLVLPMGLYIWCYFKRQPSKISVSVSVTNLQSLHFTVVARPQCFIPSCSTVEGVSQFPLEWTFRNNLICQFCNGAVVAVCSLECVRQGSNFVPTPDAKCHQHYCTQKGENVT